VLVGGTGQDRLDAGNGDDTMTGGPDADVFDGIRGNDVVTDFTPADGDRQVNVP
jgi:Ca2+-binding RTX toxin-like protein